MSKKQKAIAFGATIVVVADEIIKAIGLFLFPERIHKNVGLLFDLPFSRPILIILTLFVLLALVHLAARSYHRRPNISLACLVIVIGAVGNLYDRFAYGFVVDWIIIFGQGAFNISDVVVLSGLIALIYSSRKKIHSSLLK